MSDRFDEKMIELQLEARVGEARQKVVAYAELIVELPLTDPATFLPALRKYVAELRRLEREYWNALYGP